MSTELAPELGVEFGSTETRLVSRYTTTTNAPNIVSLANYNFAVTVTGAQLGDQAIATFGVDLQGMTCTAYVSAADTVSINLFNSTSGAIDLGSTTVKVKVFKV